MEKHARNTKSMGTLPSLIMSKIS
jgi:hypothetical protein